MKDKILDMSKKLGNFIRNSEEFKNFKLAKNKMDSDKNLVSLKETFEGKKQELNDEISKDDYDKKKVKTLGDDLRLIYEKINNFPSVSEYESSKEKLDSLISEVNSTIYENVYGSDYSTKCAGDCDSCSGCY